MTDPNQQLDFAININNLYREESVTDLNVGSIRCFIPIKADGTKDESREAMFFGHTQLMSPQGAVPLQAPIQAAQLEEAMKKFPEAMQQAMEEMMVVSEIGEQWSPNTPPPRTEARAIPG